MLKQILIARVKRNFKDAFLFASPKVKVRVNAGLVKGCLEPLPNGRKFMRFSGIPYALPPLNDLRFKAPQKLLKFDSEEIDCTRERDACFHKSTIKQKFIGSEDCLNLNVYAPADHDSTSKKAVMVFIHGGGFLMDSNSVDFYSPEYLLMNDVVVVTINYRLHTLGFISIPSLGINGNAGLKDQQMALEWVYENISNFNGDPEKICLFGESAGAQSVHQQVLNQKSRKFINTAICQSVCAISTWGYQSKSEEFTKRLAKKLNASGESDQDTLDALMKAPLEKMYLAQKELTTYEEIRRNLPFVFKPCIEKDSDDAFMTMSALDQIRTQEDKISTPMIFGCNSFDGITMGSYYQKKLNIFRDDPIRLIPENVNVTSDSEEAKKLSSEIVQYYFGDKGLCPENFEAFVNLMTDSYMIVPQMMCRELHNKFQHNLPQYFYFFDFDGKLNFLKKALKMEKYKGAAHFDELSYLFR